MESKHLGVTLGFFLLISGLFPIAGIEFLNENSSTSSITLVNQTELKNDNNLSKSSSNEVKKELNVIEITKIKEFVLPSECSSMYKV